MKVSIDESNSIKGLLISLVVLGHNTIFSSIVPESIYYFLYSFHVACFFILPFFYDLKGENTVMGGVIKYFKRLYWPYVWCFVLLSILNQLFIGYGVLPDLTPDYVNKASLFGFF